MPRHQDKERIISFLPSNVNKPLPYLMRLTNRLQMMRILLDENFPVRSLKLVSSLEIT